MSEAVDKWFKFMFTLTGLLCLGANTLFSQSGYYNLIHNADLDNWETQGGGQWVVTDGVIEGKTEAGNTDWGHLVTRQTFGDATIRFQFLFVEGEDSGIYLRSHIEGIFGVTGLQIELGVYDGWPLIVEEEIYTWVGGAPVDSGFAQPGEWNDVLIQMQGQVFTVYYNNKHVITHEINDTTQFPTEGRLALQMHSGTRKTSFLFRNIEVFTPEIITGCTDSLYREYNPDANLHDSSACTSLSTGILGGHGNVILTQEQFGDLSGKFPQDLKFYDLMGVRLNLSAMLRGNRAGMYIFRQGNNEARRLVVLPHSTSNKLSDSE